MSEALETPGGLDGAEVFIHADQQGPYGRWYVRLDDTVVYQHPDRSWRDPAIVAAATLRHSSTWRRECMSYDGLHHL